jgi:hypothetical protein
MQEPAPPNGRTNSRAIAVVAAFAGLVLGAAAASGAWLLFGNDGAETGNVSAPARIGDYYRLADVPKVRSADNQTKTVARQKRWDAESSARLSASHDGAGAVVQQYATEDLESMLTLEVVRAPSPFPQYVPYSDPEDLGIDKPFEEVLEFGDVACAVRNSPGQPPTVINCLRTSGNLTVSITRVGGDMGQRPEDVAGLVDVAWSQLD